MATELETLVVRLAGDSAGYQKMLQESMSQTAQAERAFGASAGRIQNLVGSVVAAAAGLGLAKFVKDAVANFSDAERIGLRLGSVLQMNQRDVEKTRESYEAFAKAMERVTTQEDDQILKLLTMAETYELTGEAAKKAVKDAVSLAAANEGSAESFLRMSAALAKGDVETAMHMARLVPQLRGAKNETEFLERASKLLANGWSLAQKETETFSGSMASLRRDIGNMLEDFGEVVASGLKPFVAWVREAVAVVRALDPDIKQGIAAVAGLTAALLAAGPAVKVLGLALAPVGALVGALVGGVGALLSPVGLLAGGIAALSAAFVDWREIGGQALEWMGMQFDRLSEHFAPMVEGMKDALAGKDIVLAVKILFAQLQGDFTQGIAPLRELWVGFVLKLKEVWIEMANAIKIAWSETVNWLAQRLTDLGELVGEFSAEEAAAMKKIMGEDQTRARETMARERKAALQEAQNAAADGMQAIGESLKGLYAERDRLAEEAAKKAKQVAAGLGKDGGFPDALTKQFKEAKQAVQAFDAVLAGSADAAQRIAEMEVKLGRSGFNPQGRGLKPPMSAEEAYRLAEEAAAMRPGGLDSMFPESRGGAARKGDFQLGGFGGAGGFIDLGVPDLLKQILDVNVEIRDKQPVEFDEVTI